MLIEENRKEENRKEENRIEKNLDRIFTPIFFQKIGVINVSFFNSYFDSKPTKTVSLFHYLLSNKYSFQVEDIRRCTDKEEQRKLKSVLPCITVSGIFDKRSNDGLLNHSGYICIDIDGQDNPSVMDWDALKVSLSDIPGYCYGGLSASGKGIFMIVRINEPSKHKQHFKAISEMLANRGLIVDKQCGDVSRLRGASFDSNPYLNADSGRFTEILMPTTHQIPKVSNSGNDVGFWVNKLVAEIEAYKVDMTDRYADWYAIGQSLANEFGECGRAYFHIVSRQSFKYDSDQCDEQYNRCLGHCSWKSIRTFFWFCKQYGLTCKRQAI